MHENNKARSLEWLLESGKFTTAYPKSFLESTRLPEDFLRMCVEHVLYNKGLLVSSEQLNTMYQNKRYPSRAALLDVIRKERITTRKNMPALLDGLQKERKTTRKNMIAATKLVSWVGPVHWKAALESSSNNSAYCGLGICPNKSCGMLIYKDGWCTEMRCFCGHHFYWSAAELDVKGVSEACHLIVRHRHNTSSGSGTRCGVQELVFLKRVLEIAELIVGSAMASSKKRRRGRGRRPFLQIEDHIEIVDDIRYQLTSYSSLCEDEDPKCCDISPTALPRENVSPGTDESPSTYSPIDSSLCDYIVVPNRDESSSTAYEGEHWEECSYSVLSGCETVHSIDDLIDTGEGVTMMFCYCTAVKLGISRRREQRRCWR
jgi:hypothetical protein